MSISEKIQIAQEIIQKVEQILNLPVYLVGGAVRDTLLENTVKDWDFTTPATPDEVEKAILNANKKPYLLGKKFGTIGFKLELEQNNEEKNQQSKFEYVEITTFRKEEYEENNRKPEVVFVDKIQDDLARRDFTINSMAIKNNGKIIDEFGGLEDLKNGVIKAVGNPKIRFKEDPLRILRAVRFAASLGFEIEPNTWEKLCKMRFELFKISKERWVLEIDKILSLENPEKLEKGLDLLMESGIFGVIIPELILQKNYNQNSPYHNFDLWTHTKKVVCNVPFEELDLRWTALLHDIAKPFVRTENKNGHSNYINHDVLGSQMSLKISSYLKFSNLRKDCIFENILNHLQPESPLKNYDDLGKV